MVAGTALEMPLMGRSERAHESRNARPTCPILDFHYTHLLNWSSSTPFESQALAFPKAQKGPVARAL